MSAFQITGLAYGRFAPLFDFTDAQLAAIGARRVRANPNPGYPCRVSLQDAEVGEELLLLSYQHQPGASPHRASGPIYVRRGATRRVLAPGQLTQYLTCRLISVRAYHADHMLLRTEVCREQQVAAESGRQLDDARIAYLHLHNAKPGCFSCRVAHV